MRGILSGMWQHGLFLTLALVLMGMAASTLAQPVGAEEKDGGGDEEEESDPFFASPYDLRNICGDAYWETGDANADRDWFGCDFGDREIVCNETTPDDDLDKSLCVEVFVWEVPPDDGTLVSMDMSQAVMQPSTSSSTATPQATAQHSQEFLLVQQYDR